MKRLISKAREITWKQALFLALYMAAFFTVLDTLQYVAGVLADDKAPSIRSGAEYGFGLGVLVGLGLPGVAGSLRPMYRRLGVKNASPVSES
jgi:hypothetical protein